MAELKDQSIEELELRIKIYQAVIRWLGSGDPMLSNPEYKHLVDPARDRYGKELRQLIIVCREKKVARDYLQAEFIEHVQVGLKPGRLDAKRIG